MSHPLLLFPSISPGHDVEALKAKTDGIRDANLELRDSPCPKVNFFTPFIMQQPR
jgi:hypothetical protein